MHRRRFGLLATGLLACGLAACGGGSSDDDVASSTTTTEAAATTTKAAGEADVDLRFTGTYVFQVKGKHGACTGTGGKFAFALSGTGGGGVDGIGDEFAIRQADTDTPITWEIDSTNSYEGSGPVRFDAGGTSVQIDEDLKRVGGPSDAPPRPVHVVGTITCS